MASNIDIIIQAQDKTNQAFSSAQGGLNSFKDRVESMKPTFSAMATAGTVAFGAISAIAYKAVGAYAEVERANRQLENAILNVSKGTKEQVKQVQDLTSALQKKAGIDADSLNMGVAQLSTFGLQSKSVIDLTKSLADLTVNQNGVNATGDQYIASANIMAKAMRGEFGMLQKMGIRFTEHQQELINTGTEAQKVSAIQEGLAQNLRETTDTVNGVDLAMAKNKRTMEDLVEGLGQALAPALNKLLEAVTPVIQKMVDWASANPELMGKIVMIAGAIAGLIAVLGFLGLALPAIIAGFGLLAGPVGVIALTIGVLVAGFMAFKGHLSDIISYLADTGLFDWFKQIWESISKTFTETLLPAFNRLWDTLVKLKPLFEVLGIIIGATLVVAVMGIAKALELIIKLFALLFDWATKLADFFATAFMATLKALGSTIEWLASKFEWLFQKISALVEKAKQLGGKVADTVSGAVGKVFNVNDAVVSPSGNVISTHPDDWLIATKNPESLGGGGLTINMNGGTYLDTSVAEQIGDMIIGKLNLNMRGS